MNGYKVLMASIDALPRIGGVSKAAHDLANALQAAGVDVHFLAPGGVKVPKDHRADYSIIRSEPTVPYPLEGPEWLAEGLPSLTSRLNEMQARHSYDRLIAMHPTYYGQGFWRVGQQCRTPVSIYVHGAELRSQIIWQSRLKSLRLVLSGFRPTMQTEMRRLVRESDEILVNSDYTARLVRQAGRLGPVRNIGCGIPVSVYEERKQSADSARKRRAYLKRRLGVPAHAPLVGTVCRLVPHKNVEMLIEALALMPDVNGVVVGEGPDRERLEVLARSRGVQDRVFWPGGVSENEKWEWLQAMNVFCLLSKEGRRGEVEGFGIVLLEASTAGTPIVATGTGGIPTLVKHGETGLLTDVGDIATFIENLEKLIGSDAMATSFVNQAQKRIETQFNWTLISEGLIASWL